MYIHNRRSSYLRKNVLYTIIEVDLLSIFESLKSYRICPSRCSEEYIKTAAARTESVVRLMVHNLGNR